MTARWHAVPALIRLNQNTPESGLINFHNIGFKLGVISLYVFVTLIVLAFVGRCVNALRELARRNGFAATDTEHHSF